MYVLLAHVFDISSRQTESDSKNPNTSKEQKRHFRTKDQKLHAEQQPKAARRTTTTIKASGST